MTQDNETKAVRDEIWEMAKDASARNLLLQFAKIGQELSARWRECLNESYPFLESFDEMAAKITEWNQTVQNQESSAR